MSALEGVFVAAVTPRRPDGPHVDLAATLDLVDWLGRAGVRGIALFGSTGEFIHFDIEERIRVQSLAVRRCSLPMLVNVSHTTLDGAVRLAQEAASAGATGLLLMPPPFFRYGQAQIAAFYREFARQAGASPPLLLYNIPFFTSELSAETAVELLDAGVASGIKDSSGQWEYFRQLKSLYDRKKFSLFIGNDVLFTRGRAAGAGGVVSGVACAVPELMTALDAAIVSGDAAKTARLEARLREFITRCDRFPAPAGVRLGVEARGLKTGPMSVPLTADDARLADEFRAWFPGWVREVVQEAA